MNFLEKCKRLNLDAEIIEIIENDDDFKVLFAKAYQNQKKHISGMPYRNQFEIVLATVTTAIEAVRNYQAEMKSFTDSLKKERKK